MRVKNINGASASVCRCGSWLKHWVRFSHKRLPRFCVEADCPRRPTAGALVQMESPIDDEWYVVPLCDVHNALEGQSIVLTRSATLVTANVAETCDKPPPR